MILSKVKIDQADWEVVMGLDNDKTWAQPRRCRVPLASLRAIQDEVDLETVERYSAHPNKYEPIVVILHPDGYYLIWDGHHRAHAQLYKGRKTVWADVYRGAV